MRFIKSNELCALCGIPTANKLHALVSAGVITPAIRGARGRGKGQHQFSVFPTAVALASARDASAKGMGARQVVSILREIQRLRLSDIQHGRHIIGIALNGQSRLFDTRDAAVLLPMLAELPLILIDLKSRLEKVEAWLAAYAERKEMQPA